MDLLLRFLRHVAAPFLFVPHTGSATVFFGTMVVALAIGALIPVLYAERPSASSKP